MHIPVHIPRRVLSSLPARTSDRSRRTTGAGAGRTTRRAATPTSKRSRTTGVCTRNPMPVPSGEVLQRHLADGFERAARIDEPHTADVLEHREPDFLVQHDERVAADDRAEEVRRAEHVFRVAAHAVAAAREEAVARISVWSNPVPRPSRAQDAKTIGPRGGSSVAARGVAPGAGPATASRARIRRWTRETSPASRRTHRCACPR